MDQSFLLAFKRIYALVVLNQFSVGLFLASKHPVKWSREGTGMLQMFVIKIHHSQKSFKLALSLGQGEIPNCLDFVGQWINAISRDAIFNKMKALGAKNTLVTVQN